MEAGTRTGRCGPCRSARHLEYSPMGCCGSGAELTAALPEARSSDEEVLLASRIVADGMRQTDLSVPTMHCGACVRTIEKALGGLAGVQSARANRSEEHTSELQSHSDLVCRLLLE